jgi:hypothetical protein
MRTVPILCLYLQHYFQSTFFTFRRFVPFGVYYIRSMSFSRYLFTIRRFVPSTFFYIRRYFRRLFVPLDVLSIDVFYRRGFVRESHYS